MVSVIAVMSPPDDILPVYAAASNSLWKEYKMFGLDRALPRWLLIILNVITVYYWHSLWVAAQEQAQVEQASGGCVELILESASNDRVADCLNGLGEIHYSQGHYTESIVLHRVALALARESNDRAVEAMALYHMSCNYLVLQNYQLALELAEQSLAISGEINDRVGQAYVLNVMGLAYNALNQRDRAVELYLQALVLAKEVNDYRLQSQIEYNLRLAQNIHLN